MKTIKLYKVNCNLLFNNEEEIPDFTFNIENTCIFQPSLEKAIEIYDGISPDKFDKKEILKARYRGFGNTYAKHILVVEMPLKLYRKCFFEDNGELCTPEKNIEYINEMVWHNKVNWNFKNLKDIVFEIDWITMTFQNIRNYEFKTA